MPERNTPPFPRRRESTPSSVIPAKAGIQQKETPSRPTRHIIPTQNYLQRHSHARGNPPHHPSFPQRQESISSSVIPAKAGIHNSRARGNSTKRNTIQTNQTHHSHTELPSTSFPRTRESTPSSAIPAKAGIHPIIRHSREGGNPQFPRTREFNKKKHHRPTRHIIPTQNYLQRHPTHAGIHPIIRHSREGGNSHPSFPRRRESTIPAHAGIQQKETPSRPSHSHTELPSRIPTHAGIHPIIRHSREGGNPPHHPSFPPSRE